MKSLVYSVLSGEKIEVNFPSSLKAEDKHPLRKHCSVIVKNLLSGKTETGQIVSHLPLSDWAIANAYQIISCGITVSAKSYEKTRLF